MSIKYLPHRDNRVYKYFQNLQVVTKYAVFFFEGAPKRKSRIFSIFSLVRFKNEACTPSGTKNTYLGTCYLATECAERVRGMKIRMTQCT